MTDANVMAGPEKQRWRLTSADGRAMVILSRSAESARATAAKQGFTAVAVDPDLPTPTVGFPGASAPPINQVIEVEVIDVFGPAALKFGFYAGVGIVLLQMAGAVVLYMVWSAMK